MNTRECLLREMNEQRFLVLLAMADLEEEEGDARRGRGWRWLAENGRWPLEVVRFEMEDPQDGGPKIRKGGPFATASMALHIETNGPAWEWWREKETARFSCSLPPILIEHIRKLAQTPRGATCRFEFASQALGCAATCAGLLIEVELLE